MRTLLTKLLVITLLLSSFEVFAQKDNFRRLRFGVDLSWAWIDNSEAQIYEASKTLKTVLTPSTENYSRLQDFYKDDFTIVETPQNIKYRSTMSVGGNIQLYITQTFALYANGSYISPTITNSSFAIQLNSKKGAIDEHATELGTITAKEKRFNFEFGLHKAFNVHNNGFMPYIEGAYAGSFLEMDSHGFEIGNISQDITYYSNDEADVRFSKFGSGFSCAFGLQMPMTDRLNCNIGFVFNAIRYGIFEDSFSHNKSINVRILL